MLDPTSFSGLLAEYGRAIGWSITAAIGFAVVFFQTEK